MCSVTCARLSESNEPSKARPLLTTFNGAHMKIGSEYLLMPHPLTVKGIYVFVVPSVFICICTISCTVRENEITTMRSDFASRPLSSAPMPGALGGTYKTSKIYRFAATGLGAAMWFFVSLAP